MRSHKNRRLIFLVLACIVGFSVAGISQNSKDEGRLKLAVVVVVDQMRHDHLTRFAGLYQHGLARLWHKGAVFSDAHQDHAITATGVGHATLSTGVFPARHGITGNSFYDRASQETVYCVADTNCNILNFEEHGSSPHYLLTTTIGDWLKASSPKSKVYSVARKDRSAVLMGGQKPDGAYWYRNGEFVTSDYYRKDYPKWVEAFNQAKHADVYFENGWTKLLEEDAYFTSREDEFSAEYDGMHTTFPHLFKDHVEQPNERYYSLITGTPFGDELALKFAEAIVTNENLGADETPDLLFVGCSAADGIGHSFGPLSQEAQDYYLRLDRYLGNFFKMLDERVGANNYTIVLSSDHGVLPLPEELARRGYPAKRIKPEELRPAITKAVTAVVQKLGLNGNPVAGFSNGLVLDYTVLEGTDISKAELEQALADSIRKLPLIEDVYTYDELKSGTGNGREYFGHYLRNFHPDRVPDLLLRTNKYSLVSNREMGTSHGSPYRYDTHVPLVFAGFGVTAGAYPEKARTVDVAPTLADMLGIKTGEKVDGENLKAKFK